MIVFCYSLDQLAQVLLFVAVFVEPAVGADEGEFSGHRAFNSLGLPVFRVVDDGEHGVRVSLVDAGVSDGVDARVSDPVLVLAARVDALVDVRGKRRVGLEALDRFPGVHGPDVEPRLYKVCAGAERGRVGDEDRVDRRASVRRVEFVVVLVCEEPLQAVVVRQLELFLALWRQLIEVLEEAEKREVVRDLIVCSDEAFAR